MSGKITRLTRPLPPPVCKSLHREVNASHWRQHFDDELRLRQNHRKKQEVDLLYDLYSVTALPRLGNKLCIFFSERKFAVKEVSTTALPVQ
jgi:hypothetical protein